MNQSLREKIYFQIRDDITYGRISPGERLIESQLAQRFGTSRSPVREILRQLESEGLIKFQRNKGITVSKLSIKEVDEIYTLRLLLESYAARLAAENIKKNDTEILRGLQEKLKVAAKNLDLKAWIENNDLFHDILCEHSENHNLILILDTLKRRIYRYKYIVLLNSKYFENYIEDHEGILRACERNDGAMAERYMKIHIKKVRKVALDYLNKFPFI